MNRTRSRRRWGWRSALGLMLPVLAGGCGTVAVRLPHPLAMRTEQAVSVIDRSARLNALAALPETAAGARQAWADAEGWHAVEGGRIVKLYYADMVVVTRCYAERQDVAATVCLAGLMGPFSGAYVDVAMKNGTVWRLQTDPQGDPAVFFNCLPLWPITFVRPLRKTRVIARAFETMRARESERTGQPEPDQRP